MIYCVEDEKNIRELIVYTLEATGFSAVGMEDGKALFKSLKKELPELILLDIMLPGENGYEILKKLKSEPETNKGAGWRSGRLCDKAFRYDGTGSPCEGGAEKMRKADGAERTHLWKTPHFSRQA